MNNLEKNSKKKQFVFFYKKFSIYQYMKKILKIDL